jgi:hypothetical protein
MNFGVVDKINHGSETSRVKRYHIHQTCWDSTIKYVFSLTLSRDTIIIDSPLAYPDTLVSSGNAFHLASSPLATQVIDT